MNKGITWTPEEPDRYTKRQKRLNGEPEYEEEKYFQIDAEKALMAGGFRSRTPANISKHHGGLWYIHLHKTKANPIIGDLLLLDQRAGPM